MIQQTIVFTKGTGNAKPDKFIHGGKGAGLIAMCDAGLNVPPGIIIPTNYCHASGKDGFLDKVMEEIEPHLKWLAAKCGGVLPLLSVRSGAPVSMPGMMDTILNVGAMTDDGGEYQYWFEKLGERAYRDSQRRLIEMLGATAYNIDARKFGHIRESICERDGCKSERDFNVAQLDELQGRYLNLFYDATGNDFPTSLHAQLRAAIGAVWASWNSERAVEYRKLNNIPASYGTAVTIQAMVFGNLNDLSGTGVLFSRNPSTGEGVMFGEYLVNAQGEDVVAGTATPRPVADMLAMHVPAIEDDTGVELNNPSGHNLYCRWPEVHAELVQTCFKLEALYGDMVDVEFTVQDGELFILQSRVGKRSALVAFTVAHDMVEGGLISKGEAFKRLTREQVLTLRLPSIDPSFNEPPTFKGLPACPGLITGVAVHSSAQAVASTVPCILVREETSPDDISGMAACVGILTRTGGATSHAAVVARSMDKPCVVGCTDLSPNAVTGQVTIDGSNGNVWVGIDVPVVGPVDNDITRTVMRWAAASLGCQLLEEHPVDDECVVGLDNCWQSPAKMLELFESLFTVDCSKITLDCGFPASVSHADDMLLDNCFGVHAGHVAEGAMQAFNNTLFKWRSKLKGLTIANYNINGFWPKLEKWGYTVIDSRPAAVPAEYAIFAAIAKAKENAQ